MSIGSGIAIAGIWSSCAFIITEFNSVPLIGIMMILGIAAGCSMIIAATSSNDKEEQENKKVCYDQE